MRPFFSVIIPTYNRLQYLREALESVRRQSFTDYEVIVVDDGSTDGTQTGVLEMLKSGNAQKLKLKYLRQENAGPGTARNLGAREARGEYLAFLDSDDLWFPWTLECFANSIAANNYPAILCGKIQEDQVESSLSVISHSKTSTKFYSNYISSFRDECFVGAGKIVVKKSNFHEAGGFTDLPINLEDHDFVLRLGSHDGFVEIIEPPTLIRRRHEGNLTGISAKTYDGARHLIQMEKKGAYPGGEAVRKQRWAIISRHVRPVAVGAARKGNPAVAWEIYKATFRWHVKLRKWKFLVGLPLAIITREVRGA